MRAALIYTLLFIPIVAVATLANSGAIEAVNTAGLRGDAVPWLVNFLPSLLVGIVAYAGTSSFLARRFDGKLKGNPHLRRAPLYLLSVLFGGVVVWNWSDPEFWYVGQFFLWSALVALGGILGDWFISRRDNATRVRAA